METSAFQQAYRQVISDRTDPGDDIARPLAITEHGRLRCIALRSPEMRTALLQLLDARELAAVRFEAAVDAIKLGFDTLEPRRALYEISQGSGPGSRSWEAYFLLDSWDDEHWRSMAEHERWLMMQPRQ